MMNWMIRDEKAHFEETRNDRRTGINDMIDEGVSEDQSSDRKPKDQ